MAVAANRGSRHTRLYRLSVHTLAVDFGDIRVALATSSRDIPVVGLGTGILRWKYPMAPVAIRTACSRPVSIHHGLSVHALFIEFYRMRERNLMPQEELLVAVASGASVRQMFLCYQRSRIVRGLHQMPRPMAGHATRRVRIMRRCSLPMYALAKFFHFIGMALRAFCWGCLRSDSNFVRITVAGLAGYVAEHAMDAAGHMRGFFSMASQASNLDHFVGMREIFNGRVAVGAPQSTVNTGRMFGGIDRNAFAGCGRHSCLAVAGEAAFILLQGMDCFRLGDSLRSD